VQGPGLPHNSPPFFSILCYIPPPLVLENRMLKTFRPKKDGVTRRWINTIMRSFIIWTLHRILGWPNQGRWTGHVARKWAMTNAYDILVGKPEGNSWKTTSETYNNIKIVLKEIWGCCWLDSSGW
jgi:hypothetical protein